MANRRCIDIRLVNCSEFLDMGKSSQALYFNLVANADDDGVADAKIAKRVTGIRQAALDELIRLGFIRMMDSKKCIVYVDGWQSFNTVDARYGQPSRYRETLHELFPDIELVDFKGKSTVLPTRNTSVIKDNKNKGNKGNESPRPPTLEEITAYAKAEKLDKVDCEKFYLHYQSKNWKGIIDWRSLLKKWNHEDKQKPVTPKSTLPDTQRSTDWDALIAQQFRDGLR